MFKKIALVYDAIYPYIKGGAERRYYEVAKRLAKKGHEVHLYGMKFWKGPDVIKKDGIYLHGICSVKPLYTKDGKRSIWQAIYFGINCLKLIKEDFDVIDCCGFPYFSLLACKLICLLKGKKLNSTWHEVWGKEYWKTYLGNIWIFGYLVERLAVKLPNKIIAVSEQTAIKIKKELGHKGKICTVPNGIDFELINKIKPSTIKSDVIYAGRLMDFKNIDLLIRSIFILNKNDIRCIIIGDGPEKDNLVNLTRDLRLQNNIKFMGFLENHDEVYSLIKSSKVFVLPSTREGFGLVVLEANACGIPVITVDHENNTARDLIIEGKNGYLFSLNSDDIAIKTLALMVNKNKHELDCINFAKKFDWNNIVGIIEKDNLI